MKLKELKKILDKLSNEELEQNFLYNSNSYGLSGEVLRITKNRSNLYYTGEDDPAQLYTLKQLKEEGYDKEDIDGFDIEIPKGSYYIEF